MQDGRIADTLHTINAFENKLKEQRDYLQRESLSSVKQVS
jgi:hypothetical protein